MYGLVSVAMAQEYSYTHYSTRDGLAGATCYNIIQDHDGFLWIGTETGLSRFDGKQFRTFTVADGLPSNEVLNFFEDHKHRIWIKTFSKELCYYYKGKIYNRHNTALLRELVFSAEAGMPFGTTDKSISFMNGLLKVTVIDSADHVRYCERQTFGIPYTQLLPSPNEFPQVLVPDSVGKQSRHFPSGAIRYAQRCGNTVLFSQGHGLIAPGVWGMRVLLWERSSNRQQELFWDDGVTDIIFLDEKHLLASFRKGGVRLFDLDHIEKPGTLLPGFMITGMCQDRDSNIWFSTRENGLYKLSRTRMVLYQPDDSAGTWGVRFLHKRKGILIAGLDNGLVCELVPGCTADEGIPKYRKTRRWAQMDWLKERMQEQPINNFDMALTEPNRRIKEVSINIKSLYFYGDTALLASSHGAMLYTVSDTRLISIIDSQRTTAGIYHDHQYYIGSLYGLKIYDRQGRLTATTVPHRISCLVKGHNGLWVGTYDAGIFFLQEGRVTQIINRHNSALSSDLCRCLFVDSSGLLWAGTDKGINKIEVRNQDCRVLSVITINDGLRSDVINALFIDKDTVYAATATGLNIFNKQALGEASILNLKLTGIFAGDSSISKEEKIVLPHDNNRISFDYAAISFSLNAISYRYRLRGLNEEWQPTTEKRISFLSLPSGNYVLELQAISSLGHKSPILRQSFSVQKAFYEWWWLRLLLVLGLITVLVLLFRWRVRRVRASEREKREINRKLVELRQVALSAQLNPHFIFNCLNSIQNYILKRDAQGADFYLSRFASLIRQTLNHSSRIYLSLQEEINYLNNYIELEKLQVNQPFTVLMTIDPAIDLERTMIPVMLLQPFIENAVKHGLNKKAGDGRLTISFEQEGTTLVCSIEDNGPGMGKEHKAHGGHVSKGMYLSNERIRTLNQLREKQFPITIMHTAPESGQGTKVIIRIGADKSVTPDKA